MFRRLANQSEALLFVGAAGVLAACSWAVVALVAGLPLAATAGVMFDGAFGSSFAWSQTLSAATPLLLTGLCVAIPAQAGLLIIGGEGVFVLGGLTAAVAALTVPEALALPALLLAGAVAGALWMSVSAWLKIHRNVNEAFSSLLLAYIVLAVCNQLVEGVLRDPLSNNKPATLPIPEAAHIGEIGFLSLHWGFPVGIAICVLAYVFFAHTSLGYEIRVLGNSANVARFAGLPSSFLITGLCLFGGALGGLAGAFEVGAIQFRASNGLALNYGYVGILVAMLARGNMLAVIFAAVVVGALESGGGALQRQLDAPVSSSQMMEGLLFIALVIVWAARGKLARRFAQVE